MPGLPVGSVETGFAAGAAATGAAAGVDGAASLCPGASISTNTSPTFATVPSGTTTFKTLPVTGEGISSTD